MKLKELKRTVNVCWSPAEHYPVTLAAGSAAQQVDASFSSSSSLELYSLNLEDPGVDLELKASLQTQHKFQKLVWSGAGILVGGCDGGLLQFYSSERLLNNAPDCLIGSCTKHNGHVSALDINPYQKNLLASGASESEIFIWDLNNTTQPMAPGNKSQPYDHVQDLAWNQQVQHILGSTFANRCVVWDLRKNEPIMKLSDSQSRTRWRSLAWHPSVATQVCIASEDDQVPVVQLWDLRLAASPLVTLEGHQKGVMALSWCNQDPDLLLTAGKDGRVLCWNPNNTQPGGSLLCEVSQQQQWVFDVSWSPRDPSLFVASSFDHQLTVYSLLGGSKPETNSHQQSNIMDSFGGADSFSQLPAVQRVPDTHHQALNQLPVAPNWLKRPVRAKFAFGGKLVTFDKCPQENGTPKQVYISQVVSEPEIVEKAAELDAILNSTLSNEPNACERLAEYCRLRGDQATDQQERYTWFFLRANFLNDFRTEALNLLGFKQDEIPSKFKSTNAGDVSHIQPDLAGLSRGESTETEAELSTDTSTDLSEAQTLIERKLANLDLEPTVTNVIIPNGEDSTSIICRALVCGNFEEAVELCLDAKKITDALVIASLGSPELVSKVQRWYLSRNMSDPVSLVTNALVCGKWSNLIGASGASWRHVLAALITHSSDEERAHLAEMLGNKLSKETDPALSEAATICYLVAMSPEALVQRWNRTRNGDVNSLATLTTLALLARRAALNRGRQIQPGGPLEGVVSEYASRLAAQGCLHSALTAVQGLQHAALRERLQGALLTQQQQQPQQPQQQQQQQSYSRTGRRSLARSDVSELYAPPAPGYEQPWSSSSVPAQNQLSRFQQPPQPAPLQPAPLQPTPLQPAPILPPPQAPPTQPPRPGSVGPSGGLTSRSKYKVDPSVQPAPSYNQYGYNPITSQPQSYGYNSPLPDQYQNSSIPNNSFAPINPTYSTNPGLNNANPLNPGNPVLNPTVNGNYYNQQEAPVQSKPVPPGWNDPPMQSSKSKPKQEVAAPAPITHPLFGVEPQHVPLNPTPGQQYAGQQYAGQQYAGQQYAGQQYAGQQYAGQQQYPGQYEQYQNNMISGQQQQVEPAAVAKPPTPAPKPPLPEQFLVMQSIFDRIRADCSERANNPQMKRKLEDVQRRLETLYDLLRDYKLSDSAIQSLQSCVQYCQAHDYGTALSALTALATGADFAAAASFLPGLKMLVQLAHQLQVYIS